MNNKLKECPFCGCDACYQEYTTRDYNMHITCTCCDVTMQGWGDWEALKRAWNRRDNDGDI
jgi:hypothetical protein